MISTVAALSVVGTIALSTTTAPETMGYYVAQEDTYYASTPYKKLEFGFDKLKDLSYAPVKDDSPIVLHVFKQDWEPAQSVFYAMDLDIVHHDFGHRLSPSVRPLGDDRYELTFADANNKQVLFAQDASGLFAISLTEPVARIIDVLTNTEREPHVALANVKDALKSYPDSKELQELLEFWQKQYASAAAAKSWAKIQAEWELYQSAEQSSKAMHTANLRHELGFFLAAHKDADEASRGEEILVMLDAAEKARSAAKPVFQKPAGVSELVELYQGHGIILTIAKITGSDDVLIRVKGAGNDHDGKVYRHTRVWQNESNGSFTYRSEEIDGGWNTFIVENDGWGGVSIRSYPPGVEQSVNVYKDIKTESETSQSLLDDYISQHSA